MEKGVGTVLLAELERKAKRRFQVEVISVEVAASPSSIEFCKKHGFTEFSRFENWFEIDKKMYPKICLEKKL